MTVAIQALGVLLPVLYVVCAVLHGMAFAGERGRLPLVLRLRKTLFVATMLAHLAWFTLRGKAFDQFPIVDLWTTVSAIAGCTAFLFGVVARITGHAGSGGIVLGLVFVFQLLASMFGDVQPLAREQALGPWQIAHIVSSVVAAAALASSGIHGALWLLLFRELRRRRFGALFDHLPDLDLLARMMRASALFAFVGLTVGINVGLALAHARVEQFDYLHPEVVLSLLLWVHAGGVAFSQKIRGYGARRASWAAAAALFVLMGSLLLALLPNLFHVAA